MSFFGGFAQGLSDSKRMREAQSMRELQNKLIKLQTQQYETNLKMRQSQRESAEGLIKQMRGSSPSNLISDIYQPFRPPMLAPDPNAPGATDLDAMKGQTLGEVLNTTLGQQMFLGMSPEMQRGMLGLSKFRSEEKQREAGQAWLDRQGSNGSMSSTIDPSTGALRHTFNPRTVTRETRSEDGRYWETFDQSGKLMGRRRAAP